jgi:hypothetical protein
VTFLQMQSWTTGITFGKIVYDDSSWCLETTLHSYIPSAWESVHFSRFGIDDWIIVIFISIYHLVRILQIRYINPVINWSYLAIGNLYICYKYKVGNLNARYINYYILFHHMVCWLTFQGSCIEDCQLKLTSHLGLLLGFLCNKIL